MVQLIFSRSEVFEQFEGGSWQRILFQELASTLASKNRTFPCVFGSAGFEADQLRYAFVEDMSGEAVAGILNDYLPRARQFGKNTSLIVFSPPGPIKTIDEYETEFWALLQDLTLRDEKPWPAEIPQYLDSPRWEFCFAGEPMFVVCNTPAHIKRQSRRSSAFMLTFQPRWVFESILGTRTGQQNAFRRVRSILKDYDFVSTSPALGPYGDPKNREYAQYFLRDDNEVTRCPFSTLQTQDGENSMEQTG